MQIKRRWADAAYGKAEILNLGTILRRRVRETKSG